MEYFDIEWFALETNRDYSVGFEIAQNYCISDSSVDYEGYFILSKVVLQPALPLQDLKLGSGM